MALLPDTTLKRKATSECHKMNIILHKKCIFRSAAKNIPFVRKNTSVAFRHLIVLSPPTTISRALLPGR
jgi:hypothetical protein